MINWSEIDTVLLDMDGTLLDLRFDNYFWQSIVPTYFAKKEKLSLDEAKEQLSPIFKSQEGLLNWYCLDYWSDELGIDIVKLKLDYQEHIEELPHTRIFLQAVRLSGKRCVLVTNAHAESLSIKMKKTGLIGFFDAVVSAHDFGYPKEQQSFWRAFHQLEQFDKSKTMMVDDSLSVLKAADTFGIQYLVAITQPDSTEPPRIVHEYTAVEDLSKITPSGSGA
jgi:HAD superfamily hydrolase (TIGR01509 family)